MKYHIGHHCTSRFLLLIAEADEPSWVNIEPDDLNPAPDPPNSPVQYQAQINLNSLSGQYLKCTSLCKVVPMSAYSNASRGHASKDDGVNSRLNVIRIINEPFAAAIAYGLEEKAISSGAKSALIFYLGGGSFDVSLLTIEEGNFKVKATATNTHLGGDEFDNSVVTQIVQKFNGKHKLTINGNVRASNDKSGMLTQYGAANIARVVFDKMPNRDKSSGPAMISVMVINLPKVATQTGLHSYAIVANLLINKEMLGSLNPTFVIPVCVLSAYNSIGSFDMWKRSPSSLAHPVTHFNLGSQFKFWSHGCSPNTLRTRCF